jgi:hypothetical protein
MNTGMQAACNLAWKLALVVHGVGSENLLDSYSAERSPIADQVLKVTGRVTSMATLTGKLKQSLRNHAAAIVLGLPLVRKFAADAASEISIGYPHSPLNAPGGHRDPLPGDRAPIRATEPPVGAGNTPLFALFAEPDAMPSNFLERYASLLEPTHRDPFILAVCGSSARMDIPLSLRRKEIGMRLPLTSTASYQAHSVRDPDNKKMSAIVEDWDCDMLRGYSRLCAWGLARAHARSGRRRDDLWIYGF